MWSTVEKSNTNLICAPAYWLRSIRRSCHDRFVISGPKGEHNHSLNELKLGPVWIPTPIMCRSQPCQQYSEVHVGLEVQRNRRGVRRKLDPVVQL